MKIRYFLQMAFVFCLVVTAGCNSNDDDTIRSGDEPGHERARGQTSRHDVNPSSPLPRIEHSPDSVHMANALLSSTINLDEWWDIQNTDSERAEVILALFDANPQFAISLIEATTGDLKGIKLREWLVSAWAHSDPSRCYQWINSSGNIASQQRNLLIRHLATRARMQMIRHNYPPDPWLKLLSEMRNDNIHERTIMEIELSMTSHLSRTLPIDEMFHVLESSGPLSQQGLHNLFRVAAERDIKATLDLLELRPADMMTWMESGGDVTLVQIMAKRSASDAFAWALERGDADSVERTVKAAVASWLPISSLAASDRVASLPPGDVKDAAIGVMVEWLHRMDSVDEALPWLDKLSSEELKQKYQDLLAK